MELNTKKISAMRLTFETQFKIEFFYRCPPVVKNAQNVPSLPLIVEKRSG